MLSQDFEDRVYDVAAGPLTLTAGQYLAAQSVEVRNPDAPWFLTGISWRATAVTNGIPAIRILDYTGRAIATNPVLIENSVATDDQSSAPVGTNTYLKWPQNSALRFDLQELGGVGSITFWIMFRGFKRFRAGEAPCK